MQDWTVSERTQTCLIQDWTVSVRTQTCLIQDWTVSVRTQTCLIQDWTVSERTQTCLIQDWTVSVRTQTWCIDIELMFCFGLFARGLKLKKVLYWLLVLPLPSLFLSLYSLSLSLSPSLFVCLCLSFCPPVCLSVYLSLYFTYILFGNQTLFMIYKRLQTVGTHVLNKRVGEIYFSLLRFCSRTNICTDNV